VFAAAKQRRAATIIQRSFKKNSSRRKMSRFKANLVQAAVRARCATRIAAMFRGWRARTWYRGHGAHQLQLATQETFSQKNREQRAARVADDSRMITTKLRDDEREREEAHILSLVMASADPNAEVVRWSTDRTKAPVLKQRQHRRGFLPPLATVPAQGNSAQAGGSVFRPQPQSLEPGLQSVLLTEPTSLLASTETLHDVKRRAHVAAARRLRQKYNGRADESASMRYVLERSNE
jgi:hypothetical protein